MAKKRNKTHKSTRMSAERIKQIIRENYEPGRQDKCKLAVWRNKIHPLTGISERTFWRYQKQVEAELPTDNDPKQMTLF